MLKDLLGISKKYPTGLVLSGGGARGFAHLGALKAMEEADIRPDIIAGVSAGAIVGAFYGAGYHAQEIFDMVKEKGILRYSKFQVPRNGLLNLSGLKKLINEHISPQNLEDLSTPLVIGASNFNKGKIEYFHSGQLDELVLASSSIPVLFSPVKINDYQYVDGGLYDNLPVTPLLGKCKKLIGINANPIDEEHEFSNLIQVAIRTFHLTVNATVQRSLDKFDVLIEPMELAEYEILESGKAEEVFNIGYQATRAAL